MAYSLNRAQLIGNVTREPEMRMAGSNPVATFSVATNYSWTDKATGQKKEKADFHTVVAWGKLAEICQSYVKKGNKIYVEGKMQTHDWQGEDGVKRYKTEINADNIILLDKKGGEGSSMGAGMGRDSADADDSAGSSPFQGARPQRSVKKPENEGMPAEVAHVPEVSIDDLPF